MDQSRQIESAISYIPAIDRELWVEIGMAVKSELGDSGFDLWDRWSSQADSYNEKSARAVWKSIKPVGGIGIG
ncbi:MAG: PriCT-2 domain-containing protein, partial [Gemmatimonadetes bacterium]|nr:PriCT-2 domain-containing protein [Gemmatimonadota bacterium]